MDTGSLNHIDELFESIADDSDLRDDIKFQLLNLRIPAIKTCENNDDFLSDKKHPARLNLILLTYLGSNFTYRKHLALTTSQIVDDLIHSEHLNINDFNRANAALIKQCGITINLPSLYATIHNKKLLSVFNAPKPESTQLKKSEKIKQIITATMQKIISNNILPAESHDLLLKIWPKLLYKIFLKHGKSSYEWKNATEIYHRLVESIQPVTSQQQLLVLNHDRAFLSQAMLDLLYEHDMYNKNSLLSISSIEKIYTRLIKPSGPCIQSLAESIKKDRIPTIKNRKKLKVSNISLNQLPDYIKPGQWFDLYTSNNKPAQRLKLSIISLDEEKLIFVDHRGLIAMKKNAGELCDELEKGLSSKISNYANFKTTWNSLVSKISNFG